MSPIMKLIQRIEPAMKQLKGVKFEIMVMLLCFTEETDEPQVTAERLSEITHRNVNTVRLAIAELNKMRFGGKRMIEIIHTTNNGKIGANKYRVLPDGDILDSE